MAIVQSIHSIKEVKRESFTNEMELQRIQDIVLDITGTLLRENSKLTAEVESGILNSALLKIEIVKIIDKQGYEFYGREELIERTFDWMFGYGILQYLIDDPDVSDIDFSTYRYCTVKRNGKKSIESIGFSDEKAFENFVRHIISRRGGIINENDPQCRISDYNKRLRINGSIFPRNVTGAALQIRKHPLKSPGFDTLIKRGMLNEEIAEFLCKLAQSSARIFITGKGASGKTTLLREIINKFSFLETTLLCESDTEIYPENPNVIVQKIKKRNEGGRAVTLLDLINDGLTMSLNTYVIGEMVGAEAWTILTAGLNGHRILSTGHTNNANGLWERLTTMVSQANVSLPEATLMKMYSEAIDIVIHMESYKIVEIIEVLGYDKANNTILTNKLYEFNVQERTGDGDIIGKMGTLGNLRGRLYNEFKVRGYYNV